MTRVLITGNRNWKCVDLAKKIITRLLTKYKCVTILAGGCRGVDKSFEEACQAMNVPIEIFPADWDKFGKGAGPKRNLAMIHANPLFVIAFHKDIKNSRGTANCIIQALVHKLPVYLIDNEEGDAKVMTRHMLL
jgi:hypothetical protein